MNRATRQEPAHSEHIQPHVSLKPAGAPEFTPSAIGVGLLVAAIIGASYPYVVLKLGFGPNISVVSAFFGYILLGVVTSMTALFFRRRQPANRWQNNMVQTAGTAAGQTAFLCVLMAAFDLLERDPTLGFNFHLTRMESFLWLTTAGILGVLLAVPMRRHFIVDEKLTFADGVAAGETLIVLDSHGPEAKQTARSMVGALVVSGATMLATTKYVTRFFTPLIDTWHINLNRFSSVTGVGLSLSWLNLGSGMIVGMRINASMMMGLIAAWVVAPVLLYQNGILPATAHRNDVLLWVMWPATGMLVSGGLAALFLRWNILMKTFRSLSGAQVEKTDFPMRSVAIGAAIVTVLLVLFQHLSLHMPIWQSATAIVCTLPLMLVGLRVLGETNWGPISALSNLMQGVFGLLAPGNVQSNMVASGVTGSIASESEGLMQTYKTGHMIGSTPKYLTYMNLLAVPVGAAAVAVMYPLLRDAYGIGGDTGLQSPISQKWVGFAKLLSQGFSAIHPSALYALVIGSVLGILFTVLEQKRSIRTWVPSPTGVGIGMLVPASAVATMFAGGVVELVWRRLHRKSAETYVIPVASGFIAGEALVAVILPVLIACKILQP
jgi:putative OPT family oligopeptide transporter